MSITDKINQAKASLKEMKHNRSFKKANMKREEAVEFQAAIGKCRGQLELCLKDFDWTIRTQSKNIQAGLQEHADVAIQEQILWDAAIGYMLVKDAIYSIKTVTSSNSISYSYEMLDVAVAQMNGKKKKMPTPGTPGSSKKFRNRYGYITSDAVKDEKVSLLEGFFETLKATGDIEACLMNAQDAVTIAEGRRNMVKDGPVDKTSPEYLKSIAGGAVSTDINVDDIDINSIDSGAMFPKV